MFDIVDVPRVEALDNILLVILLESELTSKPPKLDPEAPFRLATFFCVAESTNANTVA